MGKDGNYRLGAKPLSFNSRIADLEHEALAAACSVRALCEALLVEPEPMRRAKILAILAAMSDLGRGARAQS